MERVTYKKNTRKWIMQWVVFETQFILVISNYLRFWQNLTDGLFWTILPEWIVFLSFCKNHNFFLTAWSNKYSNSYDEKMFLANKKILYKIFKHQLINITCINVIIFLTMCDVLIFIYSSIKKLEKFERSRSLFWWFLFCYVFCDNFWHIHVLR